MYSKKNDNLDYESVIKQFDELMSELSNTRNKKDRNENLSKSLAFGNEDFTRQNSNNGNIEHHTYQHSKDFPINKNDLPGNQLFKVANSASEDKILPIESESKQYPSKSKHFDMKQHDTGITLSKNICNKNSFLGVKESMPWINSHLWDLEKKKEPSLFQKPNSEVDVKTPANDFKKKFNPTYCNSPKLVTATMPHVASTLDTSFYALKQKQEYLSSHKTNIKYDTGTFSYSRHPLQGKYLCHPELEFASANSSMPRSLKKPRSQSSKYILPNDCFLVKLYIETKDLHLGPFMFEIFPKMTLRLLKLKVEQEHGIVSSTQRWILGKHFAVDNDKSLADYNILPGSSIIVYVDTEQKISNIVKRNISSENCYAKNKNSQADIKKQKSGSYDNLNIIDRISVELVRKDSLDSKLAESDSKTDASSDCSNHSLKQQKTRKFTSKTKNVKEGMEFKKRTKIAYDKINVSDLKHIEYLEEHTPDFANQICNSEKQSPISFQAKTVSKEIHDKYLLNDPLNGSREELNCGGIKGPVGRTESNYKNFNIDFNYKEKHIQEENVKQATIDSENKNLEINLAGGSKTFLTEDSKNIEQTLSNIEEVKNVDNSDVKPSEKTKRKQSITSLIRKLSLTRKNKLINDYTYSQMDAVQNDEINDEKVFESSSQNTSQSPVPCDIHLEILPSDLNDFPKDECTVQEIAEIFQTDVSDHDAESAKNFEFLLEIEKMNLVENTFQFTCPVCFDEFESGQGVILHDCLHTFCRDCLTNAICYADGALVKCPYRDDFYTCESHLQQREIKALVTEEMYEKYLYRSMTTAEGLAERSFHCKAPDCKGWCIYDDAINVFHCPVCSHYNCLNCQAIHEGLNCRQYQDKLKFQQKIDKESEKTLALLNEMIKSGKALRCPKCDLILLKKWGCDWLKCSICKTEICWITKGPRWGPGGQGDTSGGCKCGVNGVKCHPSCTYCH